MQSIEARLKALEARESIRECILLYALAGDRKNESAILQQLFTADAVYDLAGMGHFEGRDAIVAGLTEIAHSVVLWSYHIPAGPLIQISDTLDSARVFWWVWCPARTRNEDGSSTPCWGAIHYNGEMVQQNGAWKFKRLLLETRLRTPFEGPWTEMEGPFVWPDWALSLRASK